MTNPMGIVMAAVSGGHPASVKEAKTTQCGDGSSGSCCRVHPSAPWTVGTVLDPWKFYNTTSQSINGGS